MSQYQFIAGGGGLGVLPHFMVSSDPRFVKVFPEKIFFTQTYWLLIPIDLHRLASVRALEKVILSPVTENLSLFLPEK